VPFTLTTGTNRFTGGDGDDTFDGGLSTGQLNTLNSGDSLAGGGGNDELTAVINASVTPTSISSIETITISATGAAALTADMSNVTGATSISNQGSTIGLTLSGVGVATTVNIQDTSTPAQVITFSNVTGTADAATVGLKNVSTTATASVLGIETLTLNSGGSGTNTLATLTTDTATKLIVTGTRGLVITNNTIAPLNFVDASANTALDNIGVDIDMAVGAVTVIGGKGNDSFEFNVAGDTSAVGGAGNDTFDYTATTNTFSIADTLAGGDGADDAMIVDHDDAVAITTAMTALTGGTVTGVERIRLNGFSDGDTNARAVTLANISSELKQVQIDAITGGANANVNTINYGAGANTLRLNVAAAISAGDTLVLDAAGTATTDSLAISNVLTTGNSGSATSHITVTDFETVSFATGVYTGAATAQNVGILSAGSTTDVTVTGSNNLVLAAGLVARSINASGLSGSAILSMGAGTTITSITGGANNDVLVGDNSTYIDGGAGDDTITGGNGNDTLIGGAGADRITTSGGAADSISAGAGNDTVVATLTAGNTMVGGDGTDILSIAVLATAASAANVSGFETYQDTAGLAQNLSLFADNPTFTTVRANSAGTTAITGASNSLANLTLVTTSTVTFDRLVNGTANALNVSITGGETLTALTAPSEETLTISSSNTGVATLALAAAELTTLNLTGSGNVIFSAAPTLISNLATVNASALTAAATLDATNSVTNMTVTGGSGVFTFTGGSGADSITGGAAADILTGGSGNDTLVGGDSGDTLAGGTGIDSLVGGGGADSFTFAHSIASGTPAATRYDYVSDWTDGTDLISFSIANTFAALGNAGLTAIDGAAGAAVARAAGAVTVTSGAANVAAITSTALTQVIKLTTAVATGDTEQAMFNAAIGTTTFSATTLSEFAVTMYNASTKQMLMLAVNSGGNTTIETGDVVTVIGAVNMSATDYTNFTAADIVFA
jgi:Ca2+-binding RTX toxin-like protein